MTQRASDITIFQKPNVTDARVKAAFWTVLSACRRGFLQPVWRLFRRLAGGAEYIRAKPQQRIGADGDIVLAEDTRR